MANSMQIIIGAALGAATIVVNIYLLKKAIGLMCKKKGMTRGFLIHLSRFIIYGIAIMISYRTGMTMLLSYVASTVIITPVSALYMTRKEGADGKL